MFRLAYSLEHLMEPVMDWLMEHSKVLTMAGVMGLHSVSSTVATKDEHLVTHLALMMDSATVPEMALY